MTAVVALLLGVVVVAVAVSVAGVLVARDAFDRLHYLAPALLVGGPALLAAVIVDHGVGLVAARVALVVAILGVASPVLTHATARAAYARGDVERLRSEDLEEMP